MSYYSVLYISTEKKFEEAIGYYSQAIELNPNIAVYYGNRSFAYLKMESYGYALIDASKALELDKTYVKVTVEIYYINNQGLPLTVVTVIILIFISACFKVTVEIYYINNQGLPLTVVTVILSAYFYITLRCL